MMWLVTRYTYAILAHKKRRFFSANKHVGKKVALLYYIAYQKYVDMYVTIYLSIILCTNALDTLIMNGPFAIITAS